MLIACLRHWYYEDFMREVNPKLPTLPLKKFSLLLFNYSPLLQQWATEHDQLFNTFIHYKHRVSVCGSIMLNDKWDKVMNLIVFSYCRYSFLIISRLVHLGKGLEVLCGLGISQGQNKPRRTFS